MNIVFKHVLRGLIMSALLILSGTLIYETMSYVFEDHSYLSKVFVAITGLGILIGSWTTVIELPFKK